MNQNPNNNCIVNHLLFLNKNRTVALAPRKGETRESTCCKVRQPLSLPRSSNIRKNSNWAKNKMRNALLRLINIIARKMKRSDPAHNARRWQSLIARKRPYPRNTMTAIMANNLMITKLTRPLIATNVVAKLYCQVINFVEISLNSKSLRSQNMWLTTRIFVVWKQLLRLTRTQASFLKILLRLMSNKCGNAPSRNIKHHTKKDKKLKLMKRTSRLIILLGLQTAALNAIVKILLAPQENLVILNLL